MARDPSDVCCAPIYVVGLVVEYVFEGGGCVEHVAGRRVQNALGFARGAAGVEHEERIFGLHPLRVAAGGSFGDKILPVVVPAFGHRSLKCNKISDTFTCKSIIIILYTYVLVWKANLALV